MVSQLHLQLQAILQSEATPDNIFAALLPVLGEILQCDRCFLYLRNPHNQLGKVPFCWQRTPDIPQILDADWKPEPESLSQDPLFTAALQAKPSVYVEDVETADPQIVNRDFEQKNFGHRALIHAHLHQDGLLWGILQPCIFGHLRIWTAGDRAVMAQVEQAVTPLAIAYITANR
ncbi:GAF domain-containing protein [Phormidium sp. CLA17]|uniref:GAF domain-containing protein n=1 Tax=Leptolyngbya sp. Cla-17 TaxID=2803751 RepID=UPI0014911B5A|nr:GAF domain-containing protein [Leptolyngbya sp. Cla-17]MBM0742023.1 GAF domain-containing protein [Leptolyngbya sp. Cla-17]